MSVRRLIGIAAAPDAPGLAPLHVADPQTDADPERARLLAHHRQVVAAAEAGAFLPAPFGIFVRNEATLTETVDAHAHLLGERLRRLGRGVEWLLRCALPAEDGPAPAAGSAYLRARAQRQRRAEALEREARRLQAAIADLGSPFADLRERGEAAYDIVFWLDRCWTGERIAAALDLGRAADAGVDARLSGPWPAYASPGLKALFRTCRGAA